MKRSSVLAALCAAYLSASCAGSVPPPVIVPAGQPDAVSAPSSTAVLPPSLQVFRESGKASWQGRELHGRTMADGGTFDQDGMTAAHRTLPLGTVIRVTNLDNKKTIDVPVTDRGPFVRDCVLELSLGAARELDIVRQGTAQVSIDSLAPVRSDGIFTVQAAVFVEEEHAKSLRARLQTKYETVYIVPWETKGGKLYRLRVGNYPSEEKAGRIAAKLVLEGLEPVVVRKD